MTANTGQRPSWRNQLWRLFFWADQRYGGLELLHRIPLLLPVVFSDFCLVAFFRFRFRISNYPLVVPNIAIAGISTIVQ